MSYRHKCKNCGYVFHNDDGSVCPQCFTSYYDEHINIIDSYNPSQKKNYTKPYVSPSDEKDKNSLIALIVLTGIATLIGLLFAIFNGM